MRLTWWHAGWLVFVPATVLLPGCEERPATLGHPLSAGLAALETQSRVRSPNFRVSGVVGAEDCSALIAGRAWGTVVRVGPDGETEPSMQSAALGNSSVMLEGDGQNVVAWATSHPPAIAWIDPDLTLRRIPIPPHPWNDRFGPLVPLPGGRIAVAPVSGRRAAVRRPEDDRPASLVQIFDTTGTLLTEWDDLPDSGELLDSWYEARGVLGRAGSRIVLVRLSRGVVEFWNPESGDEGSFTLREYFPLPRMEFDTLSFPWLTYGGNRELVSFAGRAETAAVTKERIYVLANYAFEQREIDSGHFDLTRIWTPTDQGLDIYDHSGHLLGQYRLPSGSPNWIRADDRGRIFLGYTTALEVVLDPTLGEPGCPGWPREFTPDVTDVPPSAGSHPAP